MLWKGFERKWWLPNCPSIRSEGLRKISEESLSPGRDLNPGKPKYRFQSRPRERLSRLRGFVVFLSPPRRMPG
jgi:hypothetical protein